MKFIVVLIFLLQIFLEAQESKLELGVGVALLLYPDYMGSKSSKIITIPFPYIKYSSEYLNIDKDGINRKLFDIKNLTLDLSVSGSLPANSQDNRAREGMPDLNFTFEVGPKLIYNLYDTKKLVVDFELTARGVVETDLKMLDLQGIAGSSDFKFEFNFDNLDITFRTGLRFGNDRYHNYFYGVDEKYETSTRKSYQCKSGYSGYRNKIGATYISGNWWYGAFGSYHNLKGAVYDDSPLVETNSALYLGLSLAYIFYVD